LVDAWEHEGVIRVVFIKISIIHTHILHLLLFFFNRSTGLASHSGWYTSLIKPAASSFANSFLMAPSCRGRSVIDVASSEWL
jgi:hypothetical protein